MGLNGRRLLPLVAPRNRRQHAEAGPTFFDVGSRTSKAIEGSAQVSRRFHLGCRVVQDSGASGLLHPARARRAKGPWASGHRSGVKEAGVNGVRDAKGRIGERFAPRRLTRLGPTRFGPVRQGYANTTADGCNRAWSRAKAAQLLTGPSRPAHSTDRVTATLCRAAESLWPPLLRDEKTRDRPPGTFLSVEDARTVWAAGDPHCKRPCSQWGRCCCTTSHRGSACEVNVGAGARANLRDTVGQSRAYRDDRLRPAAPYRQCSHDA